MLGDRVAQPPREGHAPDLLDAMDRRESPRRPVTHSCSPDRITRGEGADDLPLFLELSGAMTTHPVPGHGLSMEGT